MMSVQWGSATDPGRVREINEDSYLVAPNLFVVADGMGGHAAGEVASAIAVGEFRVLAEQPELRAEAIAEAIGRANQQILLSGAQHQTRSGMGTTLAGLGVVRPVARRTGRSSMSATRGSITTSTANCTR